MKELPDDPAALKRAAKNKRKQKEAATDESGTSVRSMMTGVTKHVYGDDDDDGADHQQLMTMMVLLRQ